uniref:Uncharacterized protein n=1 Tax=Arundo donax TaxID=35708 RepID=A0A0A9EI97_ARUDO
MYDNITVALLPTCCTPEQHVSSTAEDILQLLNLEKNSSSGCCIQRLRSGNNILVLLQGFK